MKYVGSKFFPRIVVTLWSSAKELDDFDHNHTKYEPQLVYHEPQLEKFDIRVNPSLEPRRPVKIYRIGSENLNGFTTFVESVLRWQNQEPIRKIRWNN
jgi:hypothetical protein